MRFGLKFLQRGSILFPRSLELLLIYIHFLDWGFLGPLGSKHSMCKLMEELAHVYKFSEKFSPLFRVRAGYI